jgi:squalene-associated FAD-dependent desaturase
MLPELGYSSGHSGGFQPRHGRPKWRVMSRHPTNVAVVGGGLAGMAAAAALAERGIGATLFEARRSLGGRAGSFIDPAGGEAVDHCQHVAMGCCARFIDFARRAGMLHLFRRDRTLHFIGPDGRQYDLTASRWLPPPLHLVPALLCLGFLAARERLAIVTAMRRLLALPPMADAKTIGQWLRDQGQSARAIERFWSVVLTSALGETLDRSSLAAARKVFADGFAATRDGYEILWPSVPLSELYDNYVTRYLAQHGVQIRLAAPVAAIEADESGVRGLRLAGGETAAFDHVILAVPWFRLGDLVPEALRPRLPVLSHVGQFGGSAISAAHLWYDRAISPLPHAVLVGRLSQWIFNHGPRPAPASPVVQAYYYQVVISASDELIAAGRDGILNSIVGELSAVWPAAAAARLVHSRLVTQRQAVFSYRPGLDAIRPPPRTAISNLYLAGDWTATGWPATMEGAVRSGEMAADAVLADAGR